MPSTSNVERVLSLALTLYSTQRGLTRDELVHLVPGYDSGSAASRRRLFVRDIARLSGIGLDVQTEPDPLDPQVIRYRIIREEGQAHSFVAGVAERAVLAAATAMWSSERGSGLAPRVRAKLAAVGISIDARHGHGTLGASAAFSPLLEACAHHRTVSFTYRAAAGHSSKRLVEPWVAGAEQGREYVLGYDRERGDVRLFRVSRIESVPKDEGPAKQPRDPHADIRSYLTRADAVAEGEVTVHVEPYKALPLRLLAGAGAEVPTFTVTGEAAAHILRLALSEPRWVHLEGNNSVAEEWASIRSTIARMHRGASTITDEKFRAFPETARIRLREVGSAGDDLTRVSAEVAYIANVGSADINDMAAHFGITVAQLKKDLTTLFLAADYSTGIDQVVDARWDDGIVTIAGAEALERPLTFTPSEAAALLLGIGALEDAGTELDPEALINVKTFLSGVLGAEQLRDPRTSGDDVASIKISLPEELNSALTAEQPVRIVYSAPGTRGVSVRDIIPTGILSMYGTLYVEAKCLLAGGVREFRVDRIVSVWQPNDHGAPRTGDFSSDPLLPGIKKEKILLAAAPHGAWVFDAFNATSTRMDTASGRRCGQVRTESAHALLAAVFEARGAIEVIAPAAVRDAVHSLAVAPHGNDQE